MFLFVDRYCVLGLQGEDSGQAQGVFVLRSCAFMARVCGCSGLASGLRVRSWRLVGSGVRAFRFQAWDVRLQIS